MFLFVEWFHLIEYMLFESILLDGRYKGDRPIDGLCPHLAEDLKVGQAKIKHTKKGLLC